MPYPSSIRNSRRKFGKIVTYEDKPSAHIKVEFSFDVVQVARGNYAPQAYHDFIGFQVAKELLERAFLDTYSLELKDVFGNVDLALGSYRKAVSDVIPKMTQVAWNLKKDELAKKGVSRRKFVYNLSRASYRKEWDGAVPEAWHRNAHPGLSAANPAEGRAAQGALVQAADTANRKALRRQLRPDHGPLPQADRLT